MSEHDRTGALTEEDREALMRCFGDLRYVHLPKVDIEAIVARHVAEAQADFLAARELSNRFMMDMETWKERAEKAEAALAEAEQKGARESLLAAADDEPFNAVGVAHWLRDRAAQIGGESDV